MNVAAILPCRGRAEQTVTNVRRLLATAQYPTWRLLAIGGRDEGGVLDSLARLGIETLRTQDERLTYWQALAVGTEATDATNLIGVANDLLPGMGWLQRAVEGYKQAFGDGDGLLGFNGDSHELLHSCHFLISRSLLDHYGGWPVWYDHTYGDTELCSRAIADGLYAKAPWALLYHDHPYWGGADDAVYAEGRALVDRDAALFDQRKRLGWPPVVDVRGDLPRVAISAAAGVAFSNA